jgi:hypothetical protein
LWILGILFSTSAATATTCACSIAQQRCCVVRGKHALPQSQSIGGIQGTGTSDTKIADIDTSGETARAKLHGCSLPDRGHCPASCLAVPQVTGRELPHCCSCYER